MARTTTETPANSLSEEAGVRRGFFSTFDVLQFPVYRTIWIGTALSFLAFHMSTTAQGVVAYDLTGSNSAVGLVQMGQGIALVFLNPISGALVDRFSKRWLMLISQTVIGISLTSIAVLLLTDSITILFLAIGSFLIGAAFSFSGPSRTALLSELMPDDKKDRAMALIQVGANFPRVAGPFFAGIMLAWAVLGAAGTYFVAAAVMGFVTATFWQVPPTPVRENSGEIGVLETAREGLSYVRRNPRVLHTVLSFQLLATFGFNYFVLMPAYVTETLDMGKASLGVLLGLGAAGGLISSLFVSSFAGSARVPMMITLSSLLLGAALIATGLAPSYAIAICTIILVGAGSSAFQTLCNVLAPRDAAPAYVGRVISIMFMAWGLNNLSGLPIGIAADAFGERSVLASLGGAVIAISILLAVWYRRIIANETSQAHAAHE